MRLLPDGFDSVDELYADDQLGQLVVSVEAAPTVLCRLGEFEDHGERRLVGEASLGSHGTVPSAAACPSGRSGRQHKPLPSCRAAGPEWRRHPAVLAARFPSRYRRRRSRSPCRAGRRDWRGCRYSRCRRSRRAGAQRCRRRYRSAACCRRSTPRTRRRTRRLRSRRCGCSPGPPSGLRPAGDARRRPSHGRGRPCRPRGRRDARYRNLSTTLRHRRFLFTDSFLLLWKWRVG